MSSTKSLLAMRTFPYNLQCRTGTLSRVCRHLGLGVWICGAGRFITGLVDSGNVVDNSELTSLLGWPSESVVTRFHWAKGWTEGERIKEEGSGGMDDNVQNYCTLAERVNGQQLT